MSAPVEPTAAASALAAALEVDALPEAEARRVDLFWSLAMVVALAFLFLVLSLFRGVGVPVALALAIAYGFNPLVTWLSKKGVPRTLGSASAFGTLLLLLLAFLWYVVPLFRNEGAKLPVFFQRASEELLPKLEKMAGLTLPGHLHTRTAELGAEASKVVESVGPALGKVAAAFAGDTALVLARVLGLLVVPVLAFFFLRDYPHLVQRAKGLVPKRWAGLVSARFAEVDGVLSSFVRGQLTVGAILSLIYCTGLSVARIDMAILIGLLAGFGNMVPYVGTALGLTLSLLSLIISWQGPWQLAVVVGTFVLAQASEGLVITPRVIGERVGLPPVAVIIAVLAFGELFGFVGVLLAVPTSAILKVVLKVILQRYKRTRLFLGGPVAP